MQTRKETNGSPRHATPLAQDYSFEPPDLKESTSRSTLADPESYPDNQLLLPSCSELDTIRE